jgi:splicing factor U2AF subunit
MSRGMDRDRDNRERDRDRHDQEQLMNNRPRSPTPPVKREPTPDLTDVIPILERKRRLTQWDIKPPGYENVTAEQAKLSGMFPLPGAPRQQTVDPSRLQAFMNQPSNSSGNNNNNSNNASSSALRPTNSRQAKRLLAYNLPESATEDGLVGFFNLQLNGLNVMYSTDPCLAAQISRDRSFAVIEFKTGTDATLALALDGISMDPDEPMDGTNDDAPAASTKGLELRRPKDYIVPAVVNDPTYVPGVVSQMVVDSVNKISITNLPPSLGDDQLTELLVSFGELKAFVLVKDSTTEESRGIAFCEYLDPAVTEIAISGLDGMDVASHKLRVKKASVGLTQVPGIEMGVNAMSLFAGTTSADDSGETRVLQLLNMVTAEELMDDEDYAEIRDDVREECEKFGTVLDLQIPRPSLGARHAAGVGKIFVKFQTKEECKRALQTLAGRKFSDRTVVTTFFPEENYEVAAW